MEKQEPTEKQLSFATTLGIPEPESYSRKTLSELIDKKVPKKFEKEVQSPQVESYSNKGYKPRTPPASFYVSYAKDIVVAMLTMIGMNAKEMPSIKDHNIMDMMGTAVAAVKMAKQEFE